MMARALACLGDKTSYGEIISATASWFEGSKAIARIGNDSQLMAGSRYTLMLPDGRAEAGVTDEHGVTGRHYAESAENINLHILMD